MNAASSRRLLAVAAPFGLSLVLLACAARAKVEARAEWSADPAGPDEAGGDKSAAPEDVEVDPLTDAPEDRNATLVGVRHDLGIREPGGTAKCSCLAVALGRPDDPKFAWQAGAPRTAPGTVAIAIRALGTPSCPDAAAPGRASISGVLRSGKDIFVEIEEVPESRPLASGALFEGPEPGGGVFVRPRSKTVPYGRKPGADGPCRVR